MTDEDTADSLLRAIAAIPAAARPLAAGVVVGERFAIERMAGTGGMGAIYRATDRMNGSPVAIKLLHGGAADITRFAREADVLARLGHDAIVRHVDHGVTASGAPYLAMEWLDGEDLRSRLEGGALSLGDTLVVFRRLAEALAHAHARGVVHRDLKPANIFLPAGELSRCKLIDFGVARVIDRTSATRSGVIIGTPAYMSPEQARGLDGIDARTDVFALGAVIFECLVGRRAFRGDTATAVLAKLVFEPPPRLGDHAPDAPLWLAMLVDRMLQRDPALRPDNATVVVDALAARSVASSPRGWLSARGLSRMFVVMARTANDDPRPTRSTALADTASDDAADAVVLINGTHVDVISGEGEASDLAREAARRARRLQRELRCRRVAVATGVGTTAGGVPMGDAIDRASRLLAREDATTRDGSIVVDVTTAELLRNRFSFRPSGDARELVEELPAMGHGRTLLGQPSPCVGRDRELGLLTSLFDECVDEASARAVLVTAPAGTGKSRLCDELVANLVQRDPELRVIAAQADPMQAGAPLEVVRALVRSGTGLINTGGGAPALDALAGRLQAALSPSDARRTANFLGELAGISAADSDLEVVAARVDQRLMRDQMSRAFEEWLRFETRERPVLLVIDDLHWGDPISTQYILSSLERLARQRLFVAMFARLEVRDRFPELAKSRSVQEVSLPPLGRRACERLVQAVIGKVDADTVERIYAVSSGNAFFAEELIRAVAQGDRELPQSLVASLQVRLARLAPREQHVARAASVFGDVFAGEGVDHLLGLDRGARDILDQLASAELVERLPGSRFAGGHDYRFRHDLLREACYALLGEADRAKAHVLAAEWLIDAGDPSALAIATHLDRGGDAVRAAVHYVRAAEQDVRAGAFESALTHVRRARELGIEDSAVDTVLGLELEIFKWLARGRDVLATAREIMERAPASSALRFQALPELALFSWGSPDFIELLRRLVEELLAADHARATHPWLLAALRIGIFWCMTLGPEDVAPLLDRAEQVAAAAPELEPLVGGWMWELRGVRASCYRPTEYRHAMTRAAACFERVGDQRNACSEALMAAFGGLATLGALEPAERELTALIARIDDLGLVRLRAKAELVVGALQAWRGDHAGARERLHHALTYLAPPALDFYVIWGNAELAALELECGDLDAAETAARIAWERGERYRLYDGAGILARVLVARGRALDALELVREPGPAVPIVWQHVASRMSARTMALRALGRMDEARHSAAEGLAFVERIAATIPDDEGRAMFRRSNADCALVHSLARELGVDEVFAR